MTTVEKITLNREMIRARFLNRKKRLQPLGVDLPDLEDLTPYLGLQELSAAATMEIDALSDVHGNKNNALSMAGLIVKSLVVQETREPIFAETDMQAVADFGLSVLNPLAIRIKEISGITNKSLDDATKNLNQTPD